MTQIPLGYHKPLTNTMSATDPTEELAPAEIVVGTDYDSSVRKEPWIYLSHTNDEHDSATLELSFAEANQLRLALQEELSEWLKLNADTREVFMEKVRDERVRQIALGYDEAHDRKHGAGHLLNWAIDYARRSGDYKTASLIVSAMEVL